MDLNRKALKSGFWFVLANLIVRAMSLITTPIFSRLLTKAEYGEFSNISSWLHIAIIVVTMRMEASFISAKFDYKDRLDQYNLSVLGLTGISTAFWILLVNVLPGLFTGWLDMRLLYINLILVYCFFHAVVNVFQMNERYAYRYKQSVFVALFLAVSSTLLSILLVRHMQNRLSGRVLGSVIMTIAVGAVLLFRFVIKGRKIDAAIWPYVLKVCIPYVPHLLSLQILNSMDRIMIRKIWGAEDTAMYTIAYSCGHMVTLLMTSMNGAFAPWLGDKLMEGAHKEIRKISSYYILLFSVMAIGMMLLAPEVLLIMGGKKYLDARYVMPPVAMGCICQFLYTLYVNIEQYKKKTVGMAFASIGAAVLNYVLNLIFIPKYGYIAAAYTTLAGYLFLLVVHMLLVRKLRYADVYDSRFILMLVGVIGLITVGVNLLYSTPILRYITVAVYAAVMGTALWIKRDMVKMLLRKIRH